MRFVTFKKNRSDGRMHLRPWSIVIRMQILKGIASCWEFDEEMNTTLEAVSWMWSLCIRCFFYFRLSLEQNPPSRWLILAPSGRCTSPACWCESQTHLIEKWAKWSVLVNYCLKKTTATVSKAADPDHCQLQSRLPGCSSPWHCNPSSCPAAPASRSGKKRERDRCDVGAMLPSGPMPSAFWPMSNASGKYRCIETSCSFAVVELRQ